MLTMLNLKMTRREARTALKEAGWTFLNGGSFATVYLSPDGKRVAKVTKPDDGARATYDLAHALPDNPHFPRYFDRVALADGGTVYEVERLEPLSGWGELYDLKDAMRGTPAGETAEHAIYNARVDGLGFDEHPTNAMRRGNVLVFTDYLAGHLDDAAVNAYDAHAGDFDGGSSRRGSDHWSDEMRALSTAARREWARIEGGYADEEAFESVS